LCYNRKCDADVHSKSGYGSHTRILIVTAQDKAEAEKVQKEAAKREKREKFEREMKGNNSIHIIKLNLLII
jgi:hypothetical protein